MAYDLPDRCREPASKQYSASYQTAAVKFSAKEGGQSVVSRFMPVITIYASASIDFVNGSVPRSSKVYAVPPNYTLVLDAIDVVTTSITGTGNP
jgi:hypothetical protein